MTDRYRTFSITAPDDLGVLGELQRWAQARTTAEPLVSITFVSAPRSESITALVAYAESDQVTPVAKVVAPMREPGRPAWLTDKLLAGHAKDAMNAYLDRNPLIDGPALTRWAQQYFPISDDYGRTVRARWLRARQGLDLRRSR